MTITYLEAIREAQEKALRNDQRVYIYGQDVGAFGGAFKATKNLAKEFPGRILDAPISEDAMVGSAIGAAIEGMRPIVEMQFADFSAVAINQIVNQAATLFWRTQVACPITIRLRVNCITGCPRALRTVSRAGRTCSSAWGFINTAAVRPRKPNVCCAT